MIEGLDLRFIRFERADEIGAGYDNYVFNGGGQPIKRLCENRRSVVQSGQQLDSAKAIAEPCCE
jgi:hypothetical protein